VEAQPQSTVVLEAVEVVVLVAVGAVHPNPQSKGAYRMGIVPPLPFLTKVREEKKSDLEMAINMCCFGGSMTASSMSYLV
jgi:hypothetical protein